MPSFRVTQGLALFPTAQRLQDSGDKATDMPYYTAINTARNRPRGVLSTYRRLTPGTTFAAISNASNRFGPSDISRRCAVCRWR